ncbi:MAG: RluA family pseudouridine synthase [Flavobacteriales bacterium]|nr:RluA family pseudouridine synthase [Flavobacteriales bacterium]
MIEEIINPEDRKPFVIQEFIVDKGQTPLRVDKFLTERIENITRSKIQRAIDEGKIWINDKYIKSNTKVQPGDKIEILSFEEPKIYEIIPEDIPIDIAYEDDQILIVNKKPGMTVHPGVGNFSGTLSNALAFYLKNEIKVKNRHPYLVHRIDKDTSGLLVVAKNDNATRFLMEQFRAHTIIRKYIALTWGSFDQTEGTIIGNITRSTQNRKRFRVTNEEGVGKYAVTHYKVLEDFTYTSLIECQLETGRTHQIRVHMKYIGHPLFADETYGGDKILKGVLFSKYKQFVDNCFSIMPRQALHAKTLGFIHPGTRKEVFFDSELPDDFSSVLEKWRNAHNAYTFDKD